MADVRTKIAGKLAGKGGLKCQCCGPAPKDKKKFDRTAKRIDRQLVEKEIEIQLQEN